MPAPATADRAVHLDSASAVPLHPAAREALLAALDDGWADPARLYRSGRRARLLLDAARESLAADLGARPDEVSFAPSGTVAAHAGRARRARRPAAAPGPTAGALRRRALLRAARRGAARRRRRAGSVAAAGGPHQGRARPRRRSTLAPSDAALVSLQSAATTRSAPASRWTRWPRAAPRRACRCTSTPPSPPGLGAARGGLVAAHRERPQVGRPGRGGRARGADRDPLALPAARRRARAPAGWPGPVDLPAGARRGGGAAGGPGRGRRAGAAAVGRWSTGCGPRCRVSCGDVEVVGHPTVRLPHLVTFSVPLRRGRGAADRAGPAGFAVSSGSSCTSSTLTPSHVLVAMGVLTHGNVRLSLHRGTTGADVDRLLAVLPGAGRPAARRGRGGGVVSAATEAADAAGLPRPALVVDALGPALPGAGDRAGAGGAGRGGGDRARGAQRRPRVHATTCRRGAGCGARRPSATAPRPHGTLHLVRRLR